MIDIFNFKKYFKKKGDNQLARIGHVNSVLPLSVASNPSGLGIVPSFIGQIAITEGGDIYIATSLTNWALVLLD